MRHLLLVFALLLATLTEASAQTRTTNRNRGKKKVAYSSRGVRRAVGPGISPRTGRPYGEALSQRPDLRDQVYLAPGVPMRRKPVYQPKSSYSNRAPRAAARAANTTVGSAAPPAARPAVRPAKGRPRR